MRSQGCQRRASEPPLLLIAEPFRLSHQTFAYGRCDAIEHRPSKTGDIKPKIVPLLGDNRHRRRILIGDEPGPMLDTDYAVAGRHNEDDVFPTGDTVCVLSIKGDRKARAAAYESPWSDHHNLSGVSRIDGRDRTKNAMRAACQRSGEYKRDKGCLPDAHYRSPSSALFNVSPTPPAALRATATTCGAANHVRARSRRKPKLVLALMFVL
jgi:hypothetical protein